MTLKQIPGHSEFVVSKYNSFIFKLLCIAIILLQGPPFLLNTYSQGSESSSFKLFTRQSFYTYEKSGEFLLHVPPAFRNVYIKVSVSSENDSLCTWKGIAGKDVIRIPFIINSQPSTCRVKANISSGSAQFSAGTDLIVLNYKPNEVKTDRLTGALIVNRKPQFPFGFYCYSPVSPTIQEEEIVRGFNMISPYQKIHPATIVERKAYMDRCAELGMKVHYNLLSVSASTGPKADTISEEEKSRRLVNEIKTFMNHPALLAWYISDEPNGFKIPPEILEKVYNTVKEIDPWHPVTMVFMAPFMASRQYAAAFDIVMADPYPVPRTPVNMISDLGKQLRNEFYGKQPQWMVIQQFGGGEWWEREPTIQETRSMTWQAIINGATGIQYFIRWGPNLFPKSTAAWNECGRMALEVAELSPWLLSDEAANHVSTYSPEIDVTSRLHNGKLAIFTVNKANNPVTININISGVSGGKADVMFENRQIALSGNTINDHLSAFGSQVYMIDLKKGNETPGADKNNLITDPGFERVSTPGVPSAVYARAGGDKGATYFTDTRESFRGYHSLRLYTPKEDQGVALRFFPCKVSAGKSYMISLWAKSDPEQRFTATDTITHYNTEISQKPQYAEISFGEFHTARFIPEERWKQFVTFVTIPSDTTATVRTNLILSMPGQGVAWFDEIRVIEEK
jgi:hypothetical protein